MTETQLLIVTVLIFGTGFTYWAWAISNTLMDILRVLKERNPCPHGFSTPEACPTCQHFATVRRGADP